MLPHTPAFMQTLPENCNDVLSRTDRQHVLPSYDYKKGRKVTDY